jgi:transcriptional regulator with XRE-family HTH domain
MLPSFSMPRRIFFTSEAGARLRELRLRAGLSQREVAERMGLRGKQARKSVSLLERGEGADPTVSTIARFLKACGARWYQFCDVLESVEIADASMPEATKELLPERALEQAESRAQDETWRYSKNQQEFFHLKPESPETRPESIEKFMTYRMLENVIQQGVLEVLRASPVATIMYPAYRGVARHILGFLWRRAKTEKGRAELMAELPKCPQCIATRLDEKEPDWIDMGLDLELVAQVQARVWVYFRETRLKSAG